MDDQIEELRAVARLDRLPNLELAEWLGEVSEEQLAALEWLAKCWPPSRGPIPWRAVRRCLGWSVVVGGRQAPGQEAATL